MADLLEYADQLRVAGRPTRAEAQVQLAAAAQTLSIANVDGIGAAAIALAQDHPDDAVAAAPRRVGATPVH